LKSEEVVWNERHEGKGVKGWKWRREAEGPDAEFQNGTEVGGHSDSYRFIAQIVNVVKKNLSFFRITWGRHDQRLKFGKASRRSLGPGAPVPRVYR
jgi:predicted alpha-1,6-mannanase (GH76 family)